MNAYPYGGVPSSQAYANVLLFYIGWRQMLATRKVAKETKKGG